MYPTLIIYLKKINRKTHFSKNEAQRSHVLFIFDQIFHESLYPATAHLHFYSHCCYFPLGVHNDIGNNASISTLEITKYFCVY